jgi:ABC-type lipoprotein release transport system permease subunit
VGALVTHEAYLRLHGDPANAPEFTAVRVTDGTDPQSVIDRLPDGFDDATRAETTWFRDVKPAELRQLDSAMPYLRGALAISYLIVLVVIAHALWTRVRANRRDLAVLAAMGCTPRQVDEVTAWHSAPLAFASLLVGLPAGVLLGHVAFTRFARSLAVVDDAVMSLTVVAALIAATVVALAVAVLGSVLLRRRDNASLRLSA